MITITGTLSKAWMSRAIGVAFGRDYYFDPAQRHAIDCLCNEYAAQTFPGMGLFYSESNLGRIDYWDKNQVQIGGIQPNMILGMLLGADFVPSDDRDADITPYCLKGKDPAELPAPEALLSRDLVRLFDEQITQTYAKSGGVAPTNSFVGVASDEANRGEGVPPLRPVGILPARNPLEDTPQAHGQTSLSVPPGFLRRNPSKGQLRPIPPFFWDSSGRAVIHGVLTTAQKLCGETIFMDMLTEPARCTGLLNWIADAYLVLCRHFAQAAGLPITDVHVGECSCCMVSPALVEEFIAPVTSRIGAALGPVRFHSCGTSTHLLGAFMKIDRLHSLDLGSGTSIREVREVAGREMPITIAPAPQDMSAESTEPILNWAGRVLDENAGGNLGYVYHLEPSYNIETIYALTDFVQYQTGGSNNG